MQRKQNKMRNIPVSAINDNSAPWNAGLNEMAGHCKQCDDYRGNDLNDGFCNKTCADNFEYAQDELKYSIRELFEAIDWATEPKLNLVKMLCDKATSLGFIDLVEEMNSDAIEMLNAHKENSLSYKF